MKHQHTKGPWKAEKTGLIYQDSTNQGIARLVSKGTELDAALIAAAPDMLVMLEIVSKRLELEEQASPGANYLLAAYREDIKALVNKANGG